MYVSTARGDIFQPGGLSYLSAAANASISAENIDSAGARRISETPGRDSAVSVVLAMLNPQSGLFFSATIESMSWSTNFSGSVGSSSSNLAAELLGSSGIKRPSQ